MASQRFCLRWNNHQTNLLSVFDQLLHAETFTDVTLAVEGQYLKAHKMVLSACSPYFQSLFTTHPEKHPIVILKDVPYADMKSLLDFMYRGEVSVDQERLTAFLKVAESLRIKGLTEVSDDNKQTFGSTPTSSSTPPPQLHRIHPYYVQKKPQGAMLLTNPLLGSALTMPKRKRGRPRKLSGSSNGTGEYDDYESNDNVLQGSPELVEVKVGTEGFPNSATEGSEENKRESTTDDTRQEPMDTSESNSSKPTPQPPATPSSKDTSPRKDQENNNRDNSTSENQSTTGLLVPKLEPPDSVIIPAAATVNYSVNYSIASKSRTLQPPPAHTQSQLQISQQQVNIKPSSTTISNAAHAQRLQHDTINNNNVTSISEVLNFYPTSLTLTNTSMPPPATTVVVGGASSTIATTSTSSSSTLTTNSRPAVRRRVRRKANSSPDDQAEQLTEMSVRGLNLFRYASINEGVYQCTECAKDNIQKTFKNKYSFQRHAFLYHEGTQRKVFPCPVCGKEFSRPDKMKNHMKTTHECYMPRDCAYPINFIINSGNSEMLKIPKLENVMSATP